MKRMIEFIKRRLKRRPRTAPSKKSSPPAKPVRKQIVLGLDFGTSGTKVVIRDLALEVAELFDWEHGLPDFPTFVLPSSVCIRQGRLFFGATAEKLSNSCRVLRSFKICLACGAGIVSCRGCEPKSSSKATFQIDDKRAVITAKQVATAFLGFVIGNIKNALRSKHGPNAIIDMWINVGVPMDQENAAQGRREFTSTAFWAEKLSGSVYDGVPLADFETIYARISQEWAEIPDETERRVFIYPETALALMSFLRSPVAKPGLFALVDVGAGTTDVSFCRLAHAPQVTTVGSGSTASEISDVMAFYQAKTRAVGSDEIDQGLARGIAAKSLVELTPGLIRSAKRAKEKLGSQKVITVHHKGLACSLTSDEVTKLLQPTVSAMLSVYRDTNFAAYKKEAIPDRWGRYSLVLLGGGNRLRFVHEGFQHFRPSDYNRRIDLLRAECPEDFRCSDKARTQFDLIAIAYGLSFSPLDYPRLFRPADVEPLPPPNSRRANKRLDRDELYPK